MPASRLHLYLHTLLDRVEDVLLVIDAERTVQFQNAAATQILKARTGISVRKGRLSLANPEDNVRLDELLRQVRLKTGFSGGSLRISTQDANRDWLLLLFPLNDATELSPQFAIHLVRRVRVRQVPSTVIRNLFDLTHGETVVVAQLIRGKSLREIASAQNRSHETIRAYVKRIFHKLEVHSQSELISLAHRISLFAATHNSSS